ncbi:OmpA family protein [Acinetobacter pullicarnis]|uniref:OmpA family protein n=1 Tax=Acinetobacter pullicarnis TaxID=2576829 RepID=UPI0011241E02|nr:OmpA family protein [Acinetobacter pullicarnis]
MNLPSKPLRIFTLLLLAFSLTGCLNLGHLSYKQARMLKKEGFTLTDEGWTLRLPERILFNFNEYEIKTTQQTELTRLSDQLKKYHLGKLKVIGHTDNIGQLEYNQQLSEKRAQSVAYIFIENGFENQNIKTIGRGSSQPLFSNDTDENRAKNRRVNITIIP